MLIYTQKPPYNVGVIYKKRYTHQLRKCPNCLFKMISADRYTGKNNSFLKYFWELGR